MMEAIVSLVGASVLGIFGWAVQIGNRLSVLETEHSALETLINTRFDETNRRLDETNDRLDNIESAVRRNN